MTLHCHSFQLWWLVKWHQESASVRVLSLAVQFAVELVLTALWSPLDWVFQNLYIMVQVGFIWVSLKLDL